MPSFLQSRPRLTLVAFCLLLWLPGLFTIPPSDRDESRFALATRQMVETGDYVRIMNGDVARNRKPIGIHWLQAPFALAARAAGLATANPIWPYRMPSLIGAILAVLGSFEIGLTLFGDRRVALLGGAMLAGSVILCVEAHIAKTDAALLGATVWAQAVLARAWMAPGTLRRRHAALFWLAQGAGILIKGPITPMVSLLTILCLSAWHRRAGWLRALRPGWGFPLLLAMVLPWLIAIGLATHGAFFSDSVGGDLGRKLAGGEETHGGLPGFHLLLLPLLAFPSTIWVLRAVPEVWSQRGGKAGSFLLAWLIPAWLVFEAVPTKLPHYTLPLYPAVFLLAAGFGLGRVPAWLRRVSLGLACVAGAGIGVAGLALAMLLHESVWLGVPGLAAACLAVWAGGRFGRGAALCAAVPLYAALFGWELPNLTALWIAPRMAAVLASSLGYRASGAGISASGYAEPSLLFLAGPHIELLPNGRSAADSLLHGHDETIVTEQDRPAFLAEAERIGVKVRLEGEADGFNYSRGKQVMLRVFVRAPP
jgi:4-amino-4-deoxy-L-arabinose transferase-like glycosyltransferase